MTKLLHIPTGQYVQFLSSFQYDDKQRKLKNKNFSQIVLIVEDSLIYESKEYGNKSLEKVLELLITKHIDTYIPVLDVFHNLCINEFEFIYD